MGADPRLQEEIKSLIRDIPDFPKSGILFRDITTVLGNPKAFKRMVEGIAGKFRSEGISRVVCVEARGFIVGSAVAYALGAGFVPIRKKGKLPHRTFEERYALEYGEDILQIHEDALQKGEKVLIVDDLLATGGTLQAVIRLLKRFDVKISGIAFIVELTSLHGRKKLEPHPVYSLVQYA